MAVLSCKITDSVTGADEQEKKGYKEEFKVMVADGDQPATILNSNHADIPKVGDSHPIDTQATVKNRSVKGTGSRNLWLLSVNYEHATGDDADNSGGGGGGGSDALQVVDVQGGVWYEDFILEQDQKGNLYRNTASDAIEKHGTRGHPMFTVTARSQEFNIDKYWGETGQINKHDYTFFGVNFKKKTLKFDDFNFRSMGGGWWEYTFNFKGRLVAKPVTSTEQREEGAARSAGWTDYQLNAGYRELDENGALIPIIPKDDNDKKTSAPVSSPWPLDEDGHAIRREELKSKIHWLEFEEFPQMAFRIFRWDDSSLLTPEAIQGIL